MEGSTGVSKGPSLADFKRQVKRMLPTSRVAFNKNGEITTIGLWQRCKRFFSVKKGDRYQQNNRLREMLSNALQAEYGDIEKGKTYERLCEKPTVLSARRINRILGEAEELNKTNREESIGYNWIGSSYSPIFIGLDNIEGKKTKEQELSVSSESLKNPEKVAPEPVESVGADINPNVGVSTEK